MGGANLILNLVSVEEVSVRLFFFSFFFFLSVLVQ